MDPDFLEERDLEGSSMVWNILKRVVPILVGLAIFLAMLGFLSIEEILGNLANVDPLLCLLAIGCIFCSSILWASRWKLFVDQGGTEVSRMELLKDLLVGMSINNLTPVAKLGGGPVRAYLLEKKEGIEMKVGLATVMAELTVLFLVMVGLVVLSVFLVGTVMDPPTWLVVLLVPFGILSSLAFMGILGVYSNNQSIVRLMEWLGSRWERLESHHFSVMGTYRGFQKAFSRCFRDKRVFAKALGYTILAKGFDFAKFYLLFNALGYGIGFGKIMVALGLGSVLLSLPTTPGSLGVYEGGIVSVLALLGVPAQISAAGIFIDRLVLYWGVTLVGGYLGTRYGIDILKNRRL